MVPGTSIITRQLPAPDVRNSNTHHTQPHTYTYIQIQTITFITCNSTLPHKFKIHARHTYTIHIQIANKQTHNTHTTHSISDKQTKRWKDGKMERTPAACHILIVLPAMYQSFCFPTNVNETFRKMKGWMSTPTAYWNIQKIR